VVSLRQFVDEFRKMEDLDFKVLACVERRISKFQRVPEESIVSSCGLHRDEARFRLKRLHRRRLIWMPSREPARYVLNYLGLDALALRVVVRENLVEGLGKSLGVGKESDVYEGISPRDERLALKFFRIGRSSFTRYARVRDYLAEEHNNLMASKRAAAREYLALRILHQAGVDVPKPELRNRHLLVTEVFVGTELASVVELEKPRLVLNKVLDNLAKAYEAGVVHSDMSTHNVLVKPGLDVTLIDWPQWVSAGHREAPYLLRRDVTNLLELFRRRWGVSENTERVYSQIVQGLSKTKPY